MNDVLASFAANDEPRRHQLIRWMGQKGTGPALRRLADILSSCTPSTPCGSAACPVCNREFQRRALDLVEETIRKPAASKLRDRMTAITIIPAIGTVAPDDLTVEVAREVLGQAEAALTELGKVAVATIDISFNEDDEQQVEPHWCVHVHAVVLDWLSDEQKSALRAAFPRSRLVSRPVVIEELDHREDGRAYALKLDRARRASYINNSNPNRKPYRDTRRRSLRPWQAMRLAVVEHQLGFLTRLITNRISKNAIGAAFDGVYNPRDGP